MSVSLNSNLTIPPIGTDAKALISPECMRKTTTKNNNLVVEPTSTASSASSNGAVSPSVHTKFLNHFQRPLKKFSLSSAFPSSQSKMSPRKVATPLPISIAAEIVGDSDGVGNRTFSSDSPGIVSNSNSAQDLIERKFSSPLDYRDSGVYLGEKRRDPVLDMLNLRKQKTKAPSLVVMRNSDDEEISPLSTLSAPPLGAKSSPDSARSVGHDPKPIPALNTVDSSKSLPAIVSDDAGRPAAVANGRRTCSTSVGDSSLHSLSDLDLLDEQSPEETADDGDQDEEDDANLVALPRRPVSSLGCASRIFSDDDWLSSTPRRATAYSVKKSSNGVKSATDGLTSKAASLFIGTPSPFSFRKHWNANSGDHRHGVASKAEANQRKSAYTNAVSDASAAVGRKLSNRTAVRHPASFFRRSRSLTNRETSRGKRKKEQEQPLQQQRSQPQLALSTRGRHRTGSASDEYESGTTIGCTGRGDRRRKISQPAMVRFQIENESSSLEQRKASVMKKKRSFADPIAKKLSFLRRRPTDSSLVSPNSDACTSPMTPITPLSTNQQQSIKQPSREEVRKWATSFDDLLSHPYGTMLFRLFLQREFSEENIDFWTACEEYKNLRDDSELPGIAKRIYSDFVAVQAPKEVNLDSVTRSVTAAGCNSPTKNTFEQAQHRIQSLMEKDSYPRFLRSDLYLELVKKC